MLGKRENKNEKKDIREWAKKLKHDEEFSKKYEGLSTVEGILATAKKDGYNIKKEELMEFDLDSVAGGFLNASAKANLDTKVTGMDIDVITTTMKNQKASMNVGRNANNSGNISMG